LCLESCSHTHFKGTQCYNVGGVASAFEMTHYPAALNNVPVWV